MKHYPNFDHVTFAYDFLKKLVFGSTIDDAQAALISFIPPGSRVLIVGGGTGKLLLDILKDRDVELITYLELSGKMIEAAKRRLSPEQLGKVRFIQGAVEQLGPEKYGVVFTPFVLDSYDSPAAKRLMQSLDQLLLAEGQWLFCDFRISPGNSWKQRWQKLMLKSMYKFFSLTTKLQANTLPDFATLFEQMDYSCKYSRYYYKGFIQSVVYLKSA